MTTFSAKTPHKIGLLVLTIITAANMMGCGVFMLPATRMTDTVALRRQHVSYLLLSLTALAFISLAIISGPSDTLMCGILIQMATLLHYLLYTSRRKNRSCRLSVERFLQLTRNYHE